MGLLDGKVALITGGARGQGRAHAVTCAREGADVILLDVPDRLSSVDYQLGTSVDLKETVSQVEALGRRALALEGDVRSQAALDGAVRVGLAELRRIDILIANAGIWTQTPSSELPYDQSDETLEANLTPTCNTST